MHKLEIALDDNYSAQQRQLLSESFSSHGFAVDVHDYSRRGFGTYAGLVILSFASLTFAELYKHVFKDAYDAWIRPVLRETLFKPHNQEQQPTLQLVTTDHMAYVGCNHDEELKAALELLAGVINEDGRFPKPAYDIWVNYKDGVWEVWTDITQPYIYRYDPVSKIIDKVHR